MSPLRRNGEWSVVLFVVALLAFNPPVLSIFSVPELIFGIPSLYLYIFVVWAAVIALLAANVPGLVGADQVPPPAQQEPSGDASSDDPAVAPHDAVSDDDRERR